MFENISQDVMAVLMLGGLVISIVILAFIVLGIVTLYRKCKSTKTLK